MIDENGQEILKNSVEGRLCVKFPWPSMARTIYGNHNRFRETYFTEFKNKYFTGDGCLIDEDGMYRITGRVDDVLVVSGHNLEPQKLKALMDDMKMFVKQQLLDILTQLKEMVCMHL